MNKLVPMPSATVANFGVSLEIQRHIKCIQFIFSNQLQSMSLLGLFPLLQAWVAFYRKVKNKNYFSKEKRLKPHQVREDFRGVGAGRSSTSQPPLALPPGRQRVPRPGAERGVGRAFEPLRAGRGRWRGGGGGGAVRGAALGHRACQRGLHRSRGVPPCGSHPSHGPRIPPAPGWARALRADPGPRLGSCCCCCCSGCWPRACKGRGAAAAPRRTATAARSTPSRRASAACSARTTCAPLRRWAPRPRPRSPCRSRRAPGARGPPGPCAASGAAGRPGRGKRGARVWGGGAGPEPRGLPPAAQALPSQRRVWGPVPAQGLGAPSVPCGTSPWTLPPGVRGPGLRWAALTPPRLSFIQHV